MDTIRVTLNRNQLSLITAKFKKSDVNEVLKNKNILVGAEFEFKVKGGVKALGDGGDWGLGVLAFLKKNADKRPFEKYKISEQYRGVALKAGDKHWGVDYDGSIGDTGMELKNPPMPVTEFIQVCPKVFDWIEMNDGYTDNKCGFHLNMSIKGERNLADKLDVMKLMMFTEEPLIDKFFKGRLGSTYVQSIRNALKGKASDLTEKDIKELLDSGKLSKYFRPEHTQAINIEHLQNSTSGRVEFRYAGHANYHKKWKEMRYLIGIFSYQMSLAYDPQFKRREYIRKLVRAINSAEKGESSGYTYGTSGIEALEGNEQYHDAVMAALEYEGIEQEQYEDIEEDDRYYGSGLVLKFPDGRNTRYLFIERSEAEELTEQSIRENFDGYDFFEGVDLDGVLNYLDESSAQSHFEDYFEQYWYDLTEEYVQEGPYDDDRFYDRLAEELLKENIVSEDDVLHELDDGTVEQKPDFDHNAYVDKYVEMRVKENMEEGNFGVDAYAAIHGDDETVQTIVENELYDWEKMVESEIEWRMDSGEEIGYVMGFIDGMYEEEGDILYGQLF